MRSKLEGFDKSLNRKSDEMDLSKVEIVKWKSEMKFSS